MPRALILIAALLFSLPVFAAEEAVQPIPAPHSQACPVSPEPVLTAQVQSDCCKGHKGVCGCRAGKIVCCDNSVSLTCTCHGEEPGTIQ